MTDHVTVGRAAELGPGEGMAVAVDREGGRGAIGIAVFNVDGEFHAIDNRCSHVGGSLGNGRLSGTTVTCPLHAASFDVTTGEVRSPPARESVRTYDAEVVDGEVRVRL